MAAILDPATDLAPFTIEHFLRWIAENELTLEDGDDWVVEEFQQAILADIFGGYREVWAIIPEGNAKSTFFGGVALYHADHTRAPWVPIGAASRDQAEILFGQAGGFVYRSPQLQTRFRVYEGYRKITNKITGGRGIKVYAADAGTGDGVIPTLALIDEPHRHKDMTLYRLWKGKLGKRSGQIAAMSTAGEPDSEFEDMREAIRGQAEERTYEGAYLRAVGKNLAYHEWMVRDVAQADDLAAVKQANPLAMITPQYLLEKRESLTLDYGTDWLRLTCNIPTRSSDAAVPEADWDACQTDERIPEGVPILVGADFAFLEDTTAITPVWVKDPKLRIFATPVILEPPGSGVMLDPNDIKTAFLELNERNPIEVAVIDPNKSQDIAQWLSQELGCLVIARSQANSFAAEDYEHFMEAVRERWLRHTGDPEFRRHVMSAVRARLPGDKHRFDRPRTQRKAGRNQRRIVIDALSAAAMVNTHIAIFEDPGMPMVAFA